MSSSMATAAIAGLKSPPGMEQDVSFHLEDLAIKLKDSRHDTVTNQHWQLINRVMAYAASAEQHISEQQTRIRELEALSTTDELTGLHNRRGLQDFMGRILSISERHRERGVLVYLDLDHFKEINDTHGHEAGDSVLVKFAGILKASLRDSDFVARIGGDEFVYVLVRTSEQDGINRARSLQAQLSSTYADIRGHSLSLEASMGVAAYDGRNSFDQILRAADIAMYEDKNRRKLLKTK